MPAVSVIMPAYDVAPYIGEAIGSVVAQTFTDWELIVVDDGSRDETRMIAERYADQHPRRIRVFSHANRGASASRNVGFRHATGELFALLDSDDAWHPEFLAAQLRVLRARPDVAIVTGNALARAGSHPGRPVRPYPDPRPEPTLREILADERAIFIMSVYRRAVYDTIGGFDEELCTNEDYEYWIRAALAGFAFARTPLPLGEYRRRQNSLSADDVRMLRGILTVLRKVEPHVPAGAPERAIIARQIARFEREATAAEARQALESRQPERAAERLRALGRLDGRFTATVASLALQWLPGLALRAYQARRKWAVYQTQRARVSGVPARSGERGAGGPASKPRSGALGVPAEHHERGAGGPASKPRSGALGVPAERHERGAGGPASKQ
jgi:GT2 family glycosyltransferase